MTPDELAALTAAGLRLLAMLEEERMSDITIISEDDLHAAYSALQAENARLRQQVAAGADLSEGVEKVRLDLLRGDVDAGDAARQLYDLLKVYEQASDG